MDLREDLVGIRVVVSKPTDITSCPRGLVING
jgi:hypothetical protein